MNTKKYIISTVSVLAILLFGGCSSNQLNFGDTSSVMKGLPNGDNKFVSEMGKDGAVIKGKKFIYNITDYTYYTYIKNKNKNEKAKTKPEFPYSFSDFTREPFTQTDDVVVYDLKGDNRCIQFPKTRDIVCGEIYIQRVTEKLSK